MSMSPQLDAIGLVVDDIDPDGNSVDLFCTNS
jgi:hypothetical protein